MKKFNITSNALATVALTCVVWICVLFAAAFTLQSNNTYINVFMPIVWLCIAAFFEWVKYKITHPEDITQG